MTGTGSELEIYDGGVIEPVIRAAPARRPARDDIDSWVDVMSDVVRLANTICNTSFVPKAYRGNGPAAAAAILTGRELNMPPMTALRHVQVVEGVPSLDAEYKRARVLAAGHELDIIEWDNDKCVMSGRRRGSSKPPLVVSYTMKDARIAGLVREGGNYVKRPRVMTLARATTLICNAMFADVTNGLATTELLESGDEDAIADYAGTGPDIPGLQQPRQRVTAADARARIPQTVTATATVIPQNVPPAEEQQAPAAASATPPAEPAGGTPRLATTGQVGLIRKRFAELYPGGEGEQDRWERLLQTSKLAGIDTAVTSIGSTKELTGDQAVQVLDVLRRVGTAAELEALIAGGEVPGGE